MSSRNSFASCAASVLLCASTSVGRCTCLDQPGRRGGLARARRAEQHDVGLARVDARRELGDRLRLVAGGLVFADDLEGPYGTCGLHLSSVGGATDTGPTFADGGCRHAGRSDRAAGAVEPPPPPRSVEAAAEIAPVEPAAAVPAAAAAVASRRRRTRRPPPNQGRRVSPTQAGSIRERRANPRRQEVGRRPSSSSAGTFIATIVMTPVFMQHAPRVDRVARVADSSRRDSSPPASASCPFARAARGAPRRAARASPAPSDHRMPPPARPPT